METCVEEASLHQCSGLSSKNWKVGCNTISMNIIHGLCRRFYRLKPANTFPDTVHKHR